MIEQNKTDNKVGSVLIVGAGIGGVQAALDLADSGYKVYLMDKKAAIGGRMAQLDKTFPTNDCSMCILAPKLVDAGRHQNIEVVTNSEVESIAGKPGNMKVLVKRSPRYVIEDKCTGCGSCWQNCPVRNEPQIIEEVPEVKLDDEYKMKLPEIMERNSGGREMLLPLLEDINLEFRYLPQNVLRYVSYKLEIPLSHIYNLATFYNVFSLTPRGKYVISVCEGTACHVKGGHRILERLQKELGLQAGETSEDLQYTLESVRCLGCCGLAPVVTVNADLHGKMTQSKIPKLLESYRE